jgi:hypothetical protein
MHSELSVLIFAAVFLVSPVTFGADYTQKLPAPNRVTKFDEKGRPKMATMYTKFGVCESEVFYDTGPHPVIRVFVLEQRRNRRLVGSMIISEETEESIVSGVLRQLFNSAVIEFCLPAIIPDYQRV